jgi:translation initiation factor IF-3
VVKEIQVRPNIDPHDLGIKLNHAQEFLAKEFKVKFVIRFRGRELEYKDKHGSELINKITSYLATFGEVENGIQREERLFIFIVAPKKQIKVQGE